MLMEIMFFFVVLPSVAEQSVVYATELKFFHFCISSGFCMVLFRTDEKQINLKKNFGKNGSTRKKK